MILPVKLIGFSFFLFFLPTVCHANAGAPMIFINLPLLTIVLIPIIAIEAFYIHKKLNASFRKSALSSLSANSLSTFIGYPIAWVLHLVIECIVFLPFSHVEIKSPPWPQFLEHFFIYTFGGAWLLPINDAKPSWVVLAVISGMIPAYFISIYFEYIVLKKFFKTESKQILLSISKKMNAITYGILIVLLIGYYIFMVLADSQSFIPFD
jgi:hypothetical protein